MKIEATPAEMSAFIAELYKEITVIAESRWNKSAEDYKKEMPPTYNGLSGVHIRNLFKKFPDNPVYNDPIGDEPRNAKSVIYDNRTSTAE